MVLYTETKPPTQSGVQYLKLGSDISLKNGSGEVIVNGNIVKVFNEEKDYLYPLPTQEMLLNPELSQNPGW